MCLVCYSCCERVGDEDKRCLLISVFRQPAGYQSLSTGSVDKIKFLLTRHKLIHAKTADVQDV